VFTCFTIVTGAFLDIIIDPILLSFMAPLCGGPTLSPCEALPEASHKAPTAA
jgi:hypothetical protein